MSNTLLLDQLNCCEVDKITIEIIFFFFFCYTLLLLPQFKQAINDVLARSVCGSVMAVFFQIYYRTDRGRFFHNWNRCTPPRVDFPTYSGAVFAVRFSRFGWFEILKKKTILKTN